MSHGSAILVEPGNVKELTQGIIKLVMDEDLRKQLGKRARERVVVNYTWEKNTSRLIQASKHLATTK